MMVCCYCLLAPPPRTITALGTSNVRDAITVINGMAVCDRHVFNALAKESPT